MNSSCRELLYLRRSGLEEMLRLTFFVLAALLRLPDAGKFAVYGER